MAYDRYDTRDMPRDERSRWRNDRNTEDQHSSRERSLRQDGPGRGRRDDRGFFERAGDEIASWFGDEDAERRRRHDQMSDDRHERGVRGYWVDQDRDYDRGRNRDWDQTTGSRRPSDWNEERSAFSRQTRGEDRYEHGRDERYPDQGSRAPRDSNWNDNRGMFARGGSSADDYDQGWREEHSGRNFNRGQADRELDQGWKDRYQPITGDYGRGGGSRALDSDQRSDSNWAEDEYRSTSRAGSANWSDRSRLDRSDQSREDRFDPHYRSWRDRHLSELDRDYDDYRAENQSRFESDFGSWRERRQQKRGLLGQIREHMEVVGSDEKPVGTVDRTAGDRLILTKSDPESGGIHHSISCSDIDRVEGNRVILDCTAEKARKRWRDESRGRALFEREDEGEMGPRMLDKSFGGTYR